MRIFLICFNLLFLSIGFSQGDIKLVDIDKYSSSFILSKYLAHYDDTHFFQYLIVKDKIQFGNLQTQGIGVVQFNQDLKEVKRFELSGAKKKETIVETFFNNGTTYLISKYSNNKKSIVHIYGFDKNGLRILEKELFSTNEDNEVQFDLSLDSSKIAIVSIIDPNSKNEECSVDACAINSEGKLLWKKSFKIGNSKEYDIKSFKVRNNGNLNFVVQSYQNNKVYSYALLNVNSTDTKSIKLVNKTFLGRLSIYESKDKFYLTGYNYLEKKDIFVNPFLIEFDELKKEIIVPNEEVDRSILDKLIELKLYKEKKGWIGYLKLAHSWENGKGEHRVVWQESFFSTQKVGGIYYKYHEAKNFYIFTYNSQEKLIDINICPMELSVDADFLFYPVKSFVSNDKLYIVYNEQENNINLNRLEDWKNKGKNFPILRQLEPSGKIKDIKLNKNIENQTVLSSVSGFTEDGDIIFYSGEFKAFTRKNFKIGLVNINSFK